MNFEEKVDYAKNYSLYIMREGIDLYSNITIVNLRSLLLDIQNRLENATQEDHHFGIKYQIIESRNYLKDNYFFKNTFQKGNK
ncbi:hypothetical protein RWE15_11330 [Virgibacillus halophilus]|uniref:Uncharacterized protein n=1 Tax=Tigheibacillus halophilus TaxID=361280 RepID=A0ABU5C8M9_9BACI|nr:hypothetical protein [Virgibacillus halophilus]